MKTRLKRLLLLLISAGLLVTLSIHPSLPWSIQSRHALNKLAVRIQMRLARWRGHPPNLASIAGRVPVKGAQVEALDSISGWATLADSDGRFVLPDVVWYPGATYDFIVTADALNVRHWKIAATDRYPEAGIMNVGDLHLEDGCQIDLTGIPGVNSVSYRNYDAGNSYRYAQLFDQLTAGKQSDEEKLESVSDYVSSKLDYEQTAWGCDEPLARIIHE